ncbi:hypothetical protein MAR_004284, partial [Mya arenaria]
HKHTLWVSKPGHKRLQSKKCLEFEHRLVVDERGERIKAVIENIRTRSKKLKKKALVPATKKVSEPKEKEKMIAERHSQELQLIKLQRFFCKLGEAEHKQMFGASVVH